MVVSQKKDPQIVTIQLGPEGIGFDQNGRIIFERPEVIDASITELRAGEHADFIKWPKINIVCPSGGNWKCTVKE